MLSLDRKSLSRGAQSLHRIYANVNLQTQDFGQTYVNLLSSAEDEIELSCDNLSESACVFMRCSVWRTHHSWTCEVEGR